MLSRMEAEGLIKRGPRRGPLLTEKGQAEAEKFVRQHRIVERFLTDFLGYSPAESHEHADELGEAFDDEMVERLAERLGRPERCPHGWPVDPAVEREENVELSPLSTLEAPAEATIVRLAEHDGELLHWFYDEGLVPGTALAVHEVHEAAGQLEILVDGERRTVSTRAAASLFVRPAA
jgi:DtxR family Mn-dependent transcriptional regulator